MQMVWSELVNSVDWKSQIRWDKEAVNNIIGVRWRMKDGRWTVDGPTIRVDPIPIPPVPFEGARIQRQRIIMQDTDEFGATVGCPSKTTQGRKPIHIVEECL